MSAELQEKHSNDRSSVSDINAKIEDDQHLEEIEEIVAAPHTRENILRYLYYEKLLTQSEIADRYDVHRKTVYKWMKKRGIEARGPGEHQTGVSIKENSNGRKHLVVNDGDEKHDFPLAKINLLSKRSLEELTRETEERCRLDRLHAHHRIPIYNPKDESGGVSIDSPNNLDGLPPWFHLGPAHDPDNPIYTYEDASELRWYSPENAMTMTLEIDDEMTDGDESGADGNNDE